MTSKRAYLGALGALRAFKQVAQHFGADLGRLSMHSKSEKSDTVK